MLLAFTVSLGDGGLWGRGGERREEKRGENEGKGENERKGENAFLDFNVLSTAQSRSPQEARERERERQRQRQTDRQTDRQT